MLDHTVSAAAPGLPINSLSPDHSSPSTNTKGRYQRHFSGLYVRKTAPIALPAKSTRIVLFRADFLPPASGPALSSAKSAPRITAVFPCEPAVDGQMLCFTRAEGYMPCSRLWFDMSRKATEDQTGPLLRYLRAKGFDLDVRHRLTPAMDATREWRRLEDSAAEVLESLKPSHAHVMCRDAMDICEAVTGIGSEILLLKNNGGFHRIARARWGSMWIAHYVFGLGLPDVARVFGWAVKDVRTALGRAQDRREVDAAFGLVISMMERMARDRMKVAA